MRDQGFTLVEALVALLIVGVIVSAILTMMSSAFASNQLAERKTGALFVAQQKMDELKRKALTDMPKIAKTEEENRTLDGKTYKVKVSYCSTASFCGDNKRDVSIEVLDGDKSMFKGETVLAEVDVSNE